MAAIFGFANTEELEKTADEVGKELVLAGISLRAEDMEVPKTGVVVDGVANGLCL